ncbi:Hypothetical predicted protein, partial [Paramuricea clavata]
HTTISRHFCHDNPELQNVQDRQTAKTKDGITIRVTASTIRTSTVGTSTVGAKHDLVTSSGKGIESYEDIRHY